MYAHVTFDRTLAHLFAVPHAAELSIAITIVACFGSFPARNQVRSGMGARAATALRRAHLSAPLPRPIPGDRPGLGRAH